MALHVLIALGVAAAWVLSLAAKPFGKCWACRGRRIRGRGRRCRACGGTGRRQRLGSRTVHRIRRQVVTHWRAPR
jgi:hypothetical protein